MSYQNVHPYWLTKRIPYEPAVQRNEHKNNAIKAPKRGQKSLDDIWFEREYELCAIERARRNGKVTIPTRKGPCGCPECVINGKPRSMPVLHDCNYARERSALVAEAVRRANEKIGERTEG
jgi:hypothetical protein